MPQNPQRVAVLLGFLGKSPFGDFIWVFKMWSEYFEIARNLFLSFCCSMFKNHFVRSARRMTSNRVMMMMRRRMMRRTIHQKIELKINKLLN